MRPKNWVHPGIQDLAEIAAKTKALKENFSQELYDSFLNYVPKKSLDDYTKKQCRDEILKRRDEWINDNKIRLKNRMDSNKTNNWCITRKHRTGRNSLRMKFKRQLRKPYKQIKKEESDIEEEEAADQNKFSYYESASEFSDPDWGDDYPTPKKPKPKKMSSKRMSKKPTALKSKISHLKYRKQ